MTPIQLFLLSIVFMTACRILLEADEKSLNREKASGKQLYTGSFTQFIIHMLTIATAAGIPGLLVSIVWAIFYYL